MSNGLFVTGTDTGVGKTFCSVKLIEALQSNNVTACGFKPIASGAEVVAGSLRNSDAERLLESGSVEIPYRTINPYAYRPAVSPNIAEKQAGQMASLALIESCYNEIAEQVDFVVVEGAGGWCTPLSDNFNSVDLVSLLKIPVVLVVELKLGCINHAVLTLNALRNDEVDVVGWIINGPLQQMENIEEVVNSLMARISIPLLARVDNLSSANATVPEFNLKTILDI